MGDEGKLAILCRAPCPGVFFSRSGSGTGSGNYDPDRTPTNRIAVVHLCGRSWTLFLFFFCVLLYFSVVRFFPWLMRACAHDRSARSPSSCQAAADGDGAVRVMDFNGINLCTSESHEFNFLQLLLFRCAVLWFVQCSLSRLGNES